MRLDCLLHGTALTVRITEESSYSCPPMLRRGVLRIRCRCRDRWMPLRILVRAILYRMQGTSNCDRVAREFHG